MRFVMGALALLLTLAIGFGYPLLSHGGSWSQVTWQHPWAFSLLVLVPVLLWRGSIGQDKRVVRLRMGTVGMLAGAPRGLRAHLRDVPGIMRAVSVALLALALARPISVLKPETSSESGIDIVVVLDVSGSMRAVMEERAGVAVRRAKGALKPSRLDIAKAVIRDFIGRRQTDRIGAIIFAKKAYVLAPPTLDYHLLDTLVSNVKLGAINASGTAIGEALGTAAARLRHSTARSKAIILLTDGDNRGGKIDPEYGAHLASVVGSKVYTIQIGTGGRAKVYDGRDLFGNPRYTTQNYPVNPELLKKISKKTGGESYIATDGNALRRSMHDVLDKLEKTRFEAQVSAYEDLFPLLVLPATLLVALDALLRAWLLRRFP